MLIKKLTKVIFLSDRYHFYPLYKCFSLYYGSNIHNASSQFYFGGFLFSVLYLGE
jgi:hypothetical protein